MLNDEVGIDNQKGELKMYIASSTIIHLDGFSTGEPFHESDRFRCLYSRALVYCNLCREEREIAVEESIEMSLVL